MPRYKRPPKMPEDKSEIIIGVGKNPDDLLVQKTSPMLMLYNTHLDLIDFKLLDVYLGRIDSHNPYKREIRLKKGELEELFGMTRLHSSVLSAHLDRLLQPITLDIADQQGKGWLKFHLFSKAKAIKGEDGIWTVTMKCSEEALQYVFYPEQIGYLRYYLREISKLQSKHSYKIFMLLESRRYQGLTWEFDLDDLKEILGCDQTATYKEFKEFNRSVLRKAQQELAAKTQCHFAYEPLYYDSQGETHRRVVGIRFTLEPLPESIQALPDPVTQPDTVYDDDLASEDPYDEAMRVRYAYGNDPLFQGFSLDQLIELNHLAYPLRRRADFERYKVDTSTIQACDLATADIVREYILTARAHGARDLYNYVRISLMRARSGDLFASPYMPGKPGTSRRLPQRRQQIPYSNSMDDGYMDQLLAAEPPGPPAADASDDVDFWNSFH